MKNRTRDRQPDMNLHDYFQWNIYRKCIIILYLVLKLREIE